MIHVKKNTLWGIWGFIQHVAHPIEKEFELQLAEEPTPTNSEIVEPADITKNPAILVRVFLHL